MASKEALYLAGFNKSLSVAGQLQQAGTVVRPGRAFLWRPFDLSATVWKPHHHLSLNKGARSLWAGQAIEFDTIMRWAACCIAFFSFSGWVNSLCPQSGVMGLLIACTSGDVAVDDHSNPSLVRSHLQKSKTDQLGRGVNIYLGRTDKDLCTVAALLTYLAVCGMEPGPLFELSNGHFLTKQTFSARVRSALSWTMPAPHMQATVS